MFIHSLGHTTIVKCDGIKKKKSGNKKKLAMKRTKKTTKNTSKQKVLLKHISDIVIDEPYLTDENKQHVLI